MALNSMIVPHNNLHKILRSELKSIHSTTNIKIMNAKAVNLRSNEALRRETKVPNASAMKNKPNFLPESDNRPITH